MVILVLILEGCMFPNLSNIYLIPKSFPCEICGTKIKVEIPPDEKFKGFTCDECKFEQRLPYWGKYFGMITNVKI